jgi:hypothetical protein
MENSGFDAFIDEIIALSNQAVKNFEFNTKDNTKAQKYILDDNEHFTTFTEEIISAAEYDNSIRLDASTKDQFEYLFNADFSNVRIHTGRYAQELTKSAKALAVTIGSDIYFAQGYYAPDTEEGMKLLAHELQHVVQNMRGDRHVYREDISGAEYEAEKIEEIMTPALLFDIPKLDKTPSLQLDETIFPYPVNKKQETAILKKSTDSGSSLEDFSKQKGKTYSILLRDGSTAKLSQKDFNEVSDIFNEIFQDRFEEKKIIQGILYE